MTIVNSPSTSPAGVRARVESNIPRWLSDVPLYRNRQTYSDCGDGERAFWNCFHRLPTITKREIQLGFPHNFLRTGADLGSLVDQGLVELERTSGTSENPIPLLLARGWWDLQERSALLLNPYVANLLHADSRRVTIVSPLCNSELSYKGIPTSLDRTLGNTRFINLTRHPFLWTDSELARMVRETAEWEPLFMDVDPVYGALFALHCKRRSIQLPSLRFIVSSYEFLSIHHRRIMERVFNVPVYNLYGSTETGHLLMENERGQMVPNPTTAFLEVVDQDQHRIGDLVVTTLSNEYMPLIRYRIGDLVRVQMTGEQVYYILQGRSRDSLTTASGQRVTTAQVDECTRSAEEILHYQLRQVGHDRFTFYYTSSFLKGAPKDMAHVKERLSELLHITHGLNIVLVDFILPEASGKFRLTQPWQFSDLQDSVKS